MKRIALLQPLPALAFKQGTVSYSEFDSLGFAILGGILREAGHTVTGISYPSNAEEIQAAVFNADAVILGDFRYYAYFCNPLPLIKRVLEVLTQIEFRGDMLVAGRHARFFPQDLLRSTRECRSYGIHLCSTMQDLAQVMKLPPHLASKLGVDVLPRPEYAPPDLILGGVLPGSVSRPTSGRTGQIMINVGCRYRCAFCEKAGTPLIGFPLQTLQYQLNEFKEAGVTNLIIWDEVFGQDEIHRDCIFEMLHNIKISFGCNTRVDLITESFVDQLAFAGCKAVLFGVEIAPHEERARRNLTVDHGKNPSMTTFRHVAELLSSRGIDAVGSVIIGLPDDTPETIEARLQDCASIGFKHLYIRPLVPFPESALYQREIKAGRVNDYANWPTEEWDTYPHGYPTLCKIKREELCRLMSRSN